MDEHLCDLGVYLVGGVRSYVDVLWEQELSDDVLSVGIGQHVYCLDNRSPILGISDVDLHREVWSGDESGVVKPENRAIEYRRCCLVQPQD